MSHEPTASLGHGLQLVGAVALGSLALGSVSGSASPAPAAKPAPQPRRQPGAPNIFFYNLDDLRDAFPGAIDPLQFMPKTRQWMADGTRFTQSFVADPSCCPSRSALMTGRYPHNNGVATSRTARSSTARTRWRATSRTAATRRTWRQVPDDVAEDLAAAVLRPLDRHVGRLQQRRGPRSTGVADRARLQHYLPRQPGPQLHHPGSNAGTKPFLLYETPQAPHWVNVTSTARRPSWPCPRPSTRPRTSAPAPACPRPTGPTSPRTCAR